MSTNAKFKPLSAYCNLSGAGFFLSLKLYHNMPYSIPASNLELKIFKNSEKGGICVPSKYNDTNCYRIGN